MKALYTVLCALNVLFAVTNAVVAALNLALGNYLAAAACTCISLLNLSGAYYAGKTKELL